MSFIGLISSSWKFVIQLLQADRGSVQYSSAYIVLMTNNSLSKIELFLKFVFFSLFLRVCWRRDKKTIFLFCFVFIVSFQFFDVFIRFWAVWTRRARAIELGQSEISCVVFVILRREMSFNFYLWLHCKWVRTKYIS